MTPAEALDSLWPRLRKGLKTRYTPESLDALLVRNRAALEELVASMLAMHRVKRGEPPQSPLEFQTYGELAVRQRARDAEPDEVVIGRVIARLGKLRAEWKDDEARAFQAMQRFGEIRALAVVVRQVGLDDAVPLLLTRPALVLLQSGRVLGVVSDTRQLHAPSATNQDELSRAIEKADAQLRRLSAGLAEPTSESALRSYLATLWDRARSGTAPVRVEPAIDIPPDLRDRKWRTEANIRAIQLVHDKRRSGPTSTSTTCPSSGGSPRRGRDTRAAPGRSCVPQRARELRPAERPHRARQGARPRHARALHRGRREAW